MPAESPSAATHPILGCRRRGEAHAERGGLRLKDGAAEATATWEDVGAWYPGENDGLWNGTYLASQAFRYAATKGTAEAEAALSNLRKVLNGNERLMAITGVPAGMAPVVKFQVVAPVIPALNEHEVARILSAAAEAGASGGPAASRRRRSSMSRGSS